MTLKFFFWRTRDGRRLYPIWLHLPICVLGAVLFAGHAWAAECPVGELCYPSTACGPLPFKSSSGASVNIASHLNENGECVFEVSNPIVGKQHEDIIKRLDEIKHILRCLDDAVRPSWTTEPCQ